jgi:colicin import membrane protein
MSNETKNAESKTQIVPADKVAAVFVATEKSFADLEIKAANARREIREQNEVYARAQDDRQRATEQWNYEEEQRRRAVLDRQREEDRERERRYAERETSLNVREKSFAEIAVGLFGIQSSLFDPKTAEKVLADKLDKAENKGKGIAKAEAERDYATKKSIDDAMAAKDLALLKAENERLKSDNTKLETENKRLSTDVMELAKRQGDLATSAFGSAGGIQRQAMDSLQSAAQNALRTNPR